MIATKGLKFESIIVKKNTGLIFLLFSLQSLTGLFQSLSAQFGFSSMYCFLLPPSCIYVPFPWIVTSPSRSQFNTSNTSPEPMHCWRLDWCGLYPFVSISLHYIKSTLFSSWHCNTLQVVNWYLRQIGKKTPQQLRHFWNTQKKYFQPEK